MNALNLVENIIRLRHDKKITQEQLADFVGVTKASVSKWETKQSMPDILLLPRLASFFDVTIDELFTKKEWIEVLRTGKFVIITVLFILFGVMNPAITKLTPWMMEAFSESLEESGLTMTEAKVDALTSWMQFYKNESGASPS